MKIFFEPHSFQKRFLKHTLIFFIFLNTAIAAPVQLSYEEAARYALGENPDLKALHYQEESLRYHAKQALAPNNPVFSLSQNDMSGLSLKPVGASTVYGLSFTLGFPGKALSQSANQRHQAEATRELALAKEVDLLTALSNNYVALSSSAKLDNFLQSEVQKARDLLTLLEKKYTAAQAAQADLLNARVVVVGLEHDILENDNARALLLTQFLNLIKKPGSKDFLPAIPDQIIVPKLAFSLDELTAIMLKNRHQLVSAQKQVEAAQSALTNASLAALPDFQLFSALNFYRFPSSQPNPSLSRDYSVGIGIAVPIFFPFNELQGIHAATRDRENAEAQQESAKLQALADLQSAYTGFISNQKSVDNDNDIVLPATKASYELTLKIYSFGKADYFVLNAARSTWIEAQKDLLSKQVNAAQFFNQIISQLGCDITNKEVKHACVL